MENLTHKKCVPCEGGVDPLTQEEAAPYYEQVKSWTMHDKSLEKHFKFKDFKEAMIFVNKVAEIAEGEGHHPDIYIYYNKVKLELTTHAIGGLSINDFIIASKVDQLTEK